MAEGFFKKAAGVASQAAYIGIDPGRMRDRVENAVDDGVIAARRAAKHGRYVAEDLLGEATHCIKKNPVSAVAVSFWAGFGLGVLAVLLGFRDRSA